MANNNDNFSNKLLSIQTCLNNGQNALAVKECGTLFETIFRSIYSEAMGALSYEDRKILIECENEIGKGKKGVQEFGLGELVGLFNKAHILEKWSKETKRDLGLINTIKLDAIVTLRNDVTHHGDECEATEAQLIYSYLKNFMATLGYINMEKAIKDSFAKAGDDSEAADADDQEVLAELVLQRDRGVIINKADTSRNISFRVDTINSIFDTFVKEIASIADEETAQAILWKMGNNSGRAFGEVINKKWQNENSELSYNEKIAMWCDFDSIVGWGRLQSNLDIDADEGEIKGDFRIKENFMCYGRKKKQVKLCNYIKGYCSGVISELLDDVDVCVDCDMCNCPQDNGFKKECIFSVKLD